MRKTHLMYASSREKNKSAPIAMSPNDFGMIMRANKGYDKKFLQSGFIVECFIACNSGEVEEFLESLSQVMDFPKTLWMEVSLHYFIYLINFSG